MARYEDLSLLEAALVGYQTELARITTAIADLQQRLGKRRDGSTAPPFSKAPAPRKHQISAEGRARIAAAQRKRWAAARGAK